MEKPPQPDNQPPPGPLRPEARVAAIVAVYALLILVVFIAAASNCDETLPPEGFWCGINDGFFWVMIVLLFPEPVRKFLVRKWPQRRWPEPLRFFVAYEGVVWLLFMLSAAL